MALCADPPGALLPPRREDEGEDDCLDEANTHLNKIIHTWEEGVGQAQDPLANDQKVSVVDDRSNVVVQRSS